MDLPVPKFIGLPDLETLVGHDDFASVSFARASAIGLLALGFLLARLLRNFFGSSVTGVSISRLISGVKRGPSLGVVCIIHEPENIGSSSGRKPPSITFAI